MQELKKVAIGFVVCVISCALISGFYNILFDEYTGNVFLYILLYGIPAATIPSAIIYITYFLINYYLLGIYRYRKSLKWFIGIFYISLIIIFIFLRSKDNYSSAFLLF